MYNIHQEAEVKRTQIYLSESQWRDLSIISGYENKSISELIRKAISKVYNNKDKDRFINALSNVEGLWKDRKDIGKTEDFLRKIRKDNRIERFFKK